MQTSIKLIFIYPIILDEYCNLFSFLHPFLPRWLSTPQHPLHIIYRGPRTATPLAGNNLLTRLVSPVRQDSVDYIFNSRKWWHCLVMWLAMQITYHVDSLLLKELESCPMCNTVSKTVYRWLSARSQSYSKPSICPPKRKNMLYHITHWGKKCTL